MTGVTYLANIKSTIKNKPGLDDISKKINTEAANVIRFDILVSKRYSIFSIYRSITTTVMSCND